MLLASIFEIALLINLVGIIVFAIMVILDLKMNQTVLDLGDFFLLAFFPLLIGYGFAHEEKEKQNKEKQKIEQVKKQDTIPWIIQKPCTCKR